MWIPSTTVMYMVIQYGKICPQDFNSVTYTYASRITRHFVLHPEHSLSPYYLSEFSKVFTSASPPPPKSKHWMRICDLSPSVSMMYMWLLPLQPPPLRTHTWHTHTHTHLSSHMVKTSGSLAACVFNFVALTAMLYYMTNGALNRISYFVGYNDS